MTRAKKKKQPKSPLKDWKKKPPKFGDVKNAGAHSVENIGKRAVLNFMRGRFPDMGKSEMARETGYSLTFVKKRWDDPTLQDKPRSGRPNTARTDAVMKRLGNRRGKRKNSSNRKMSEILTHAINKISYSSVSRGYKELGLPYLRRPKVSRLNERNRKDRHLYSKRHRKKPVSYWEKKYFTDEKIFQVDGYDNPQNDGVRETSAKHVEPKEKSKYPAQRMVWLGMTSKGTGKLHIIPAGTTENGTYYLKRILKKDIPEIKSRTVDGERIDEKVLFEDPNDWFFEHDYAPPHGTIIANSYLEENVPAHNCLLPSRKYEDNWMSAKLDDVIPIERLWAIWCKEVYAPPVPTNIHALILRIRKAHRNTKVETLTKLVHQIPAKLEEIYRLKGGRIHPSWDYHKSKYKCKCDVCSQ